MSAFLFDVGSFAVKAGMVALYIALVAGVVALLFSRRRSGPPDDEGTLVASRMDLRQRGMSDAIRRLGWSDKRVRAEEKERDAQDEPEAASCYVTDFDGDLSANAVEDFRRVVTAIIGAAAQGDEVVVRLRSPGGTVPGYGLAASQMQRLRDAGLRVTAAVDTVAASGGYMMAVVSDELVAAPFAVVGSIGVYLPVPNVNRLLDGHGVEVRELTSGKYTRTVSFLGELTDEGVAKTQQMLDDTHGLFKAHVAKHRPGVDIEAVSTGEYWYGTQAIGLGLVDRLAPSDEVLAERAKTHKLVRVEMRHDDPMARRFASLFASAFASTFRSTFRSVFGSSIGSAR